RRGTTFCGVSCQDGAVYTGDLVTGEDKSVNLMANMEGEKAIDCRCSCFSGERFGDARSRTPWHVEAWYRVAMPACSEVAAFCPSDKRSELDALFPEPRILVIGCELYVCTTSFLGPFVLGMVSAEAVPIGRTLPVLPCQLE